MQGKVLAIDASIWIVRIDTSLTTNTEKIKSILNKIMLLKRHNILPVFVFDGSPPALKRKTLEERYRKRIVANDV
jgi:5'-3' exonuclease